MFPTKAPGPDGFPALFYQNFWDVVGFNTIDCCLKILNKGKNIKERNKTNIALIPKKKNPLFVSDFHPISLCNANYKIVTKLIANQLKQVLDGIISINQSAFILDRSILDNVIIGHECLHFIQKRATKKKHILTELNECSDRR